MEIQLTAKQIKVTPAIRAYVREKVEKAQKYFNHIVRAQVFLFIEKRAHKAEVVMHAPRQTFRAMATAADLYAAVDLAADKIDHQLKKFKEKLKSKHKAERDRDAVVDQAAPAPENVRFFVVRQPVTPTTPHEAVRDMEAAGQEFRLFQDRDTRQIHVVYRRSDETFGILQPVQKSGGLKA